MGIDDIANHIRSDDPADLFSETYLSPLPENQWPSYIDETTRLLLNNIGIGETELSLFDVANDLGDEYQRGLLATTGARASDALVKIPSKQIGKTGKALNKLQDDLERSSQHRFDDPSQAIEAVVNKKLLELYAAGKIDTEHPPRTTLDLPANATVADLVVELFNGRTDAAELTLLVDSIEDAGTEGLLALLDEPRMVTPLWDHQREALTAWLDADCRGTVDMATATGKTVLGLAAIAHHFGALHPNDEELVVPAQQPPHRPRAHDVLIVAHRQVILDQWQREFDKHLNIPEEAHTSDRGFTVKYEWGKVHFWTADRVLEEGVPSHDLAILDEAHHYIGAQGFGEILDGLTEDVLALSGSLDEENVATLERRTIPRLFTFTPEEAKRANIIPECRWTVQYVPYEDQAGLAEVTENARTGLEKYGREGSGTPTEGAGASLVFDTLDDVYTVGNRTEARELAERDHQFRAFLSAARSRRTTRWNLSPALDPIVDLAARHALSKKCVVLLDSTAEIDYVEQGLRTALGLDEDDEQVRTIGSENRHSTLDIVETFDDQSHPGALIGIGETLGEGVDIVSAEVAINRGRGGFNQSLIQRMGRVLRNPDGTKQAAFYHVTAIPTEERAMLVEEDGRRLLETAAAFLRWGGRFGAGPVFETTDDATARALVTLEQGGVRAIGTQPDYEWPEDLSERRHLHALTHLITGAEVSALLTFTHPDTDPLPQPGSMGPAEYELDHRLVRLARHRVKTDSQYDSLPPLVNTAVREYVTSILQEETDE